MPYRIDLERTPELLVLSFQGLLDAPALADLATRVAAHPGPVRVLLRTGTEVDPACAREVRRLRAAAVVAESPFLTRWLELEDRP